jgi:hypothetical protein
MPKAAECYIDFEGNAIFLLDRKWRWLMSKIRGVRGIVDRCLQARNQCRRKIGRVFLIEFLITRRQ